MKTLLCSCCVALILFTAPLSAQIRIDFEDSNVTGFQLEGLQEEGNLQLAENTGNPGNCLRIDKSSPVLRQMLTLSRAFYGRWAATKVDSVFFDVLIHDENGSPLQDFPWAIEIAGPGGRAVSLPNLTLTPDVWHHVAVALDPFFWDIQEGSWAELNQYVDQVRIRVEYTDGSEYVLIDNPGLTFTPLTDGPRLTACSSFENYGFGGWQFKQTGGIEWNTADGNPNGTIRIAERLSDVSKGFAPAKFLGDWSSLDGSGYLEMDLRINTLSGLFLYDKAFFLYIKSPGGKAYFPADRDEIRKGLNEWHTFQFPINESEWVIEAGNWEDIIRDVTSLEVDLEFISTPETVFMDNVCLQNPQATSTEWVSRGPVSDFFVYPNPTQEDLHVRFRSSQPLAGIVTLTDIQGRIRYRRSFQYTGNEKLFIPVRHLAKGTYLLHIKSKGNSYTEKVVIGK